MRARRLDLVYPSLLGTYPVVQLAAGNPGEFLWSKLPLVMALGFVAAAVVHLLTAALLRRRSRDCVAFVAAVVVAWLFCAPTIGYRARGLVLPRYTVAALLVAAVALVVWRLRRADPSPAASRGAGAFSLALVGAAALSLTLVEARIRRTFDSTASVDSLRVPLAPPLAPGAHPDVYLLVLDNVSNSHVMQSLYDVDRRPFEDSLRALGFTVPSSTRSNYCHTAQSLATLLNAGQVRVLQRDLGQSVGDRAVLNMLSRDNRVSRWFRSSGYQVYYQPSVGFAGTTTNASATGTFGPSGWDRVRLAMASSDLLLYSSEATVLGRIRERFAGEAERAHERLFALRTVPQAAALPGPKFVIAHSLAAHQPYVYDSTCNVVGKGRHVVDRRGAYVAAVGCTERLTLAAVHSILRASRVPPVIVLQADHGTMTLAAPEAVDSAVFITPAEARECTGAFGAYLMPGGVVPDTVTTANVFRYVVRALGGRVELDSDNSYYNAYAAPYRFVDVTRYVTRPFGPDSAGGARTPLRDRALAAH